MFNRVVRKPDIFEQLCGGKMTFKKFYLLLPLIILFPYIVLSAFICLFSNAFMDTVFKNNGLYLFLTLMIIYIIAFVCSIILFITNIVFKRDSLQLLRINMIIKIIHIPAYVLIFLFGLLCLITIFSAWITLILMVFDIITIFLTGLIGFGGIIRGVIENKISKKTAAIYAVLQFVFCFDVISSILLYRKIKTAHNII
jgi:hypothetical protein